MASLMDIVKNGSGLFESAHLEKPAGSSGTSVTPIESAVQGYNPDAAKMSGTPNQVRNAVRTGMDEKKDLTTARRQMSPQKTTSATEKDKQAEAAKLASLGSLQGRVQQLVDKTLTQAATGAQLEVDDAKLPTALSPEQKSQLKQDILVASGQAAVPGRTAAQALASANNLLGKKADSLLQPVELQGYLVSAEKAAADKLAKQAADDFKVAELNPTELGFASMEDIAQTLGLDAAAMQGMSINQFIKAVQDKTAADFSNADRWRKVLADPTASLNEREEARRILREMGATGERGAEKQMDTLSAEIATGNRVRVGDNEYSVEELLKDESVAQLAKTYFMDKDEAAAIKAQNPQLAAFFDRNAQVLKDATRGIEESAEALQGYMEQRNADRDSVLEKLGGDRALARLLFPDFDSVSTDRLASIPLLDTWNKMNRDQQAQVSGTMTGLMQLGATGVAKELAGMDASQLQALGLTTPQGAAQFKTLVEMSMKLAEAEPGDVDSILEGAFGAGKVQQAVNDAAAAKAAGFSLDSEMTRHLDRDWDGVIDDRATVQARLRNYYGGDPVGATRAGKSIRFADTDNLMNKVSGYQYDMFNAMRDGKFDANEAQFIGQRAFDKGVATGNLSELQQLASRDKGFEKHWAAAAGQLMANKLTAVGSPYSFEALTGNPAVVDTPEGIAELRTQAAHLQHMNTDNIPPELATKIQKAQTRYADAIARSERADYVRNMNNYAKDYSLVRLQEMRAKYGPTFNGVNLDDAIAARQGNLR